MAREYGWLLDEGASAGRENLDPGHVSRYDAKEDADVAKELVLLERLGLNPQSVIVDLGAGTGQFVMAAAAVCARVVAVDVSPVMLKVLQTKATASGLTNIDIAPSGFLTYAHQGQSADFVYSRFALHHLPDFWKAVALQRIRRILRPGGVFRLWDVVYNFDPADAEERLESWCETGGQDIETGWSRTEYEEHIRDEHSTFTWILEPMLVRCGFEIEDAVYSQDGIFARYVARAI